MQPLWDLHRAPACKLCRVHKGLRHCYSRHHKGHPRLVPVPRGAQQRTLFGLGGMCASSPPPPEGGGDDEEMASQRSGADLASTGRSGGPSRGHQGVGGGEGAGYAGP